MGVGHLFAAQTPKKLRQISAGGKGEVVCETSGTVAAIPVYHGLWGPPACPNCPQPRHRSFAGGTISCKAPSTLVWFSSSLPLIDTQSRVAAVGVLGGARQHRAPAPCTEVEVSIAPCSPALAPRGASGWRRCPPGPNEVVQSALHFPNPWLGTLASGRSSVVEGTAGPPCLAPTNKVLPLHKPYSDI